MVRLTTVVSPETGDLARVGNAFGVVSPCAGIFEQLSIRDANRLEAGGSYESGDKDPLLSRNGKGGNPAGYLSRVIDPAGQGGLAIDLE
jgi:hypothetical protein